MLRVADDLAESIAINAAMESYRQYDLMDTENVQAWLRDRGMWFQNWETIHF